MPGTSAIRFALAGALLGVVGAVAALTLAGGGGSAPVAASPGTSAAATPKATPAHAAAAPSPKSTVAAVARQTLAAYTPCEERAAATARRAARYDGSPALSARLGSAALETSERCAEAAVAVQDELQTAAATDNRAFITAVAGFAGLAQRQAASAGSLATGLALGQRPARSARAYAARERRLESALRAALRSLERAG